MKPESVRRSSALEFYSLGAVTETKVFSKDTIKVTPFEDFVFEDGYLAEIKRKHNVTIPDNMGRIKKTDVEGSVVIEAKWIPFGHSNRISAPDVVKNETVIIFRYGSNDTYYWTTIFREPLLRRLEKALYAWSNLRDGIGKKAFDRLTSYWAEVSTLDKWVWLKTNKNDGEPFTYDVKIDTKNGNVKLWDSAGEYIEFNSATGTLTAKMNRKIHLIAPIIELEASEKIISTAPLIHEKATEKILNEAPLIHEKASAKILSEAPLVNAKADLILEDAPLVRNTGKEHTVLESVASPHICCVPGPCGN